MSKKTWLIVCLLVVIGAISLICYRESARNSAETKRLNKATEDILRKAKTADFTVDPTDAAEFEKGDQTLKNLDELLKAAAKSLPASPPQPSRYTTLGSTNNPSLTAGELRRMMFRTVGVFARDTPEGKGAVVHRRASDEQRWNRFVGYLKKMGELPDETEIDMRNGIVSTKEIEDILLQYQMALDKHAATFTGKLSEKEQRAIKQLIDEALVQETL